MYLNHENIVPKNIEKILKIMKKYRNIICKKLKFCFLNLFNCVSLDSEY